MSEPFSASGSFMDAKSLQGGVQTTTSDILFLKRLLFLKASLDNDQSLSNFAVPFDEDKAFQLRAGEVKPSVKDARQGISTAPAINGKRQRLSQPFSLEDDPEEKPLALTNGGINDDLNDSLAPMKAMLPPTGHGQRQPPRTAGSKVRPNKQKRPAGNSLNLHAPEHKDSKKRLNAANAQHENALLGRIEQNKYVTERDTETEAIKLDEGKRRQRLEQVNY